jgi:hypothetical protein
MTKKTEQMIKELQEHVVYLERSFSRYLEEVKEEEKREEEALVARVIKRIRDLEYLQSFGEK